MTDPIYPKTESIRIDKKYYLTHLGSISLTTDIPIFFSLFFFFGGGGAGLQGGNC